VILRNRYRPLRSLGGGGFAKTYLAEDVDKLNEKCVIKQFAPQVQGFAGLRKATDLFEQEARRLQQLGEHSQIPTLLAYFREESRLYLIQQFIDGQNLLKDLQQNGPFSEQRIWNLLPDLLNILTVVHQQQVIHRDIKPENIIQRGDGKVVLIDFGAAKQLTQTVMTAQGTMIGSLGYAPLEQMKAGEAYPASDLFSLGVTCFHLLTGIHPWQPWQVQGYSWTRNWQQHLQHPISETLTQILHQLLQVDWRQRYQSAPEVIYLLNQRNQPTANIPPTISPTPANIPPTLSEPQLTQQHNTGYNNPTLASPQYGESPHARGPGQANSFLLPRRSFVRDWVLGAVCGVLFAVALTVLMVSNSGVGKLTDEFPI
jgi:serine/threonine protein kinase